MSSSLPSSGGQEQLGEQLQYASAQPFQGRRFAAAAAISAGRVSFSCAEAMRPLRSSAGLLRLTGRPSKGENARKRSQCTFASRIFEILNLECTNSKISTSCGRSTTLKFFVDIAENDALMEIWPPAYGKSWTLQLVTLLSSLLGTPKEGADSFTSAKPFTKRGWTHESRTAEEGAAGEGGPLPARLAYPTLANAQPGNGSAISRP